MDVSATESWSTVRDILYECSGEVLGFRQRKHRDWFDDNDDSIRPLLKNLHDAHSLYLQDKNSVTRKTAYTSLRQEVQKRLREMKTNGGLIEHPRYRKLTTSITQSSSTPASRQSTDPDRLVPFQ